MTPYDKLRTKRRKLCEKLDKTRKARDAATTAAVRCRHASRVFDIVHAISETDRRLESLDVLPFRRRNY